MKMVYIIGLFLLVTGCEVKEKADDNISSLAKDTSVFTVIKYDSSLSYILEGGHPTELNEEDYKIIDSLIRECIKDYNVEQELEHNALQKAHPEYNLSKKHFIIELERYKRQYVAVEDNSCDKIVWVNCFCDVTDTLWKHSVIEVLDGGNCFFNIKLNITKQKCFDLHVNGDS